MVCKSSNIIKSQWEFLIKRSTAAKPLRESFLSCSQLSESYHLSNSKLKIDLASDFIHSYLPMTAHDPKKLTADVQAKNTHVCHNFCMKLKNRFSDQACLVGTKLLWTWSERTVCSVLQVYSLVLSGVTENHFSCGSRGCHFNS